MSNLYSIISTCHSFSPSINSIVVIPAFKEPALLETLKSLHASTYEPCGVVVVLNYGCQINQADKVMTDQIGRVIQTAQPQLPNLELIILAAYNLDPKHWGVGLARKIGLDFACEQAFKLSKKLPLIWLDADCKVSKNYLPYITNAFQNDQLDLAHLYFEHASQEQAICYYELFLRYYYHSLRSANYPLASYTVGSCLVCSSHFYRKQGGMNKRKAGEDFYFLSKNMMQAQFAYLTGACVYPSDRRSARVPFGTGKALQRWDQGDRYFLKTYHPTIFKELGHVFQNLAAIYTADPSYLKHNQSGFYNYLIARNYSDILKRLSAEAKTDADFKKRFLRWFNGFKILKYIHYRRVTYPDLDLLEACTQLLKTSGLEVKPDVLSLLKAFRISERQSTAIY